MQIITFALLLLALSSAYTLNSYGLLTAAGDLAGTAIRAGQTIANDLLLAYVEAVYFLVVSGPEALKQTFAELLDMVSSMDLKALLLDRFLCDPPQTLFLIFTFPQSRYCYMINSVLGVEPVVSNFDTMLIYFLISLTALLGLFSAYFLLQGINFRTRVQEVAMLWLMPHMIKPHLKAEHLRGAFNGTPFPKRYNVEGHTHGESAGDRSMASMFAEILAQSLGYKPYFVQMSRADERKSRKGSRTTFWSKDLNVEKPLQFAPDKTDLLVFVDVDQYMDIPQILCDNFQPALIYTFQPSAVSKIAKEYSFTFLEDSSVEYRVTGGGKYVHQVWNYSHDNLLLVKKFLGIPYKLVSFGVDKRQTAPDHELIMLTPLGEWVGWTAAFSYWFVQGNPLERLNVVKGRFTRLVVSSMESGLLTSTGKVGEYANATIPTDVDNTLATISQTSKFPLTMPQAVSYADGDKVAGAVLLDYHRNNVGDKAPIVYTVSESIRAYQFNPTTYSPSDKPLMEPFMSPFLLDCFVPTQSLSSEQVAVSERVEKVAPPVLPLYGFLVKTMEEFVEFLIPEPHQLDPVDDDELYSRQARPSQRTILEQAQFAPPVRVVQSFLKKESYGDVKAPRVISTINGSDKAAYSKFIYAFAELLKDQPWYAFGKSPCDIAERVTEVCQAAENDVANTDFRKFDGHGSNVMRHLEQLALLRAFRVCYHDELLDLHRGQSNLRAFTVLGVEYLTLFSRLSGSPDTATFNGTVNAFVAYLEKRLTREDGTSYTPQEAWDALGIYGGDDGLSRDVDPRCAKRAARMIGQDLEVEPIMKGDLGVKFLARVYSPDVWYGDVNTCCDLPRQLTKLHVTVRLGQKITPEMKFLEKMRAYFMTDENTPLLGDLVRRARFLLAADFEANEATAAMRPWGSDVPKEVQYKNEPADWMTEYLFTVIPEVDLPRFNDWVLSCNSLEDLMKPPLLREGKPAESSLPVVVDDDILPLVNVTGAYCKGKPSSRIWDDSPKEKPERPSGKQKEKPTPEEFEAWKAKKIKLGTWREKPTSK